MPTSADTVTFDASSGAGTVTLGANANCSTLTLTNGTQTFSNAGGFKITVAGSGSVFTNGTGIALSNAIVIESNYSGANTRTFACAAATEGNTWSLSVTAGTGSVVITGAVRDAAFSNFTGALTNNAISVYGSLTFVAGMTVTAGANAITFAATSGVKTITTAGLTVDCPITFNGVGGTWQLQDSFTGGATRTITLTNGTLGLNSNALTVGIFSSNNSNTRSVLFGAGSITLTSTAAGTPWAFQTATGFTYTGTATVNLNSAAVGGTAISLSHGPTAGATEANTPSFNITSGVFALTVYNARDLNLAGFTGSFANATRSIYGSLTLGAGMTFTAGALVTTFAATSGTKTITSNGITMDCPVTFNGAGGTWQLGDALAVGSSRAVTLTNGTFNANNKNVSLGTFILVGGTKALTMGSGTWTVAGSGSRAFDLATNAAGLTLSAASAVISMTSGSAKTFAGNGGTFGTLDQNGAGALTVTGSNTFADIRASTKGTTITLTSGTTQTVSAFSLAGTAGNLVTLNSSSVGVPATLSKSSGAVNATYLSIKDSAAIGGAVWTARYSVNVSDNTGWVFTNSGGLSSGTQGLSQGAGLYGGSRGFFSGSVGLSN